MRKRLYKLVVNDQPYYVAAFRKCNAVDFFYVYLNSLSSGLVTKRYISSNIKNEPFPKSLVNVSAVDDFSKHAFNARQINNI